MTQGKSALEQWWATLSPEQKLEAHRAQQAGQMTDEIANSLSSAHIPVTAEQRRTQTFSSSVDIFIKTRHD